MESAFFLQPIDKIADIHLPAESNTLGNIIDKYHTNDQLPDISDCDAAIISVLEDRCSPSNSGCGQGANKIREYLYRLRPGMFKPRIVDLGNLPQGKSLDDTFFALGNIIEDLLKMNIIPIILGGGKELNIAVYQAFSRLQKIINLVEADNNIDLSPLRIPVTDHNYLTKIFRQQPNYLFNYTILGYQTYFVDQQDIKLLDSLFFDAYRLGQLKNGRIVEAEPVIRNTDVLSFNIASVRASDAPGCANATPNGFTGEEACQIARYAGMSDYLSVFGIYEYNPLFDPRGLTAHLIAQMLWYFIEGLYFRMREHPSINPESFITYNVPVEHYQEGIVFYRSKKTDRWWMEIGKTDRIKPEFIRHAIIPCSAADYQMASSNEVPDRWWKAYQKLM